MVKVVRPLFSNSAVGKIGNIGTFRRGRHGPEFIAIAEVVDPATEKQLILRGCFATAKKNHSLLDKRTRDSWPVYWSQWLVDHPECSS